MVTDDVVVHGPGQNRLTVSGEGASRVFSVLGAEATFKNLTIANGMATDSPADPEGVFSTLGFAMGGGIANLRGSVHLNRVTMHNNHAAGLFGFGVVLPTSSEARSPLKTATSPKIAPAARLVLVAQWTMTPSAPSP